MRTIISIMICFAIASSAVAGVATPKLWTSRTIELAICSQTDTDKGDRKLCGSRIKLSGPMTDLVRQAITKWNNTFQGYIIFQETKVFHPDTVRVSASSKPGDCRTNFVGYNPKDGKEMEIGTACARLPATKIGSVLHEMGHIVGLHHEQRRPDRSTFETLDFKILDQLARGSRSDREIAYQYLNLCDATAPQSCTLDFGQSLYTKENGRIVGDFDFGSVMIYSLNKRFVVGLTKLGNSRLTAQHLTAGQVGQRSDLSPDDIATVKTLYP